MRTSLQQAGYPVIDAAAGSEALVLFQQYVTRIVLVISDVQMPEMSGVDLAGRLRRLRPGLPILFVSGDCEALPLETRGYFFLQKPFCFKELISGVELALTKSNNHLSPAARWRANLA